MVINMGLALSCQVGESYRAVSSIFPPTVSTSRPKPLTVAQPEAKSAVKAEANMRMAMLLKGILKAGVGFIFTSPNYLARSLRTMG
jgi:hypothetical protein